MPYYDYEDYESIAEDSDELYEDDQWDYDDVEHQEWENYYHNIASELDDE